MTIKIDPGKTRKQYDKLPPEVQRFITFESYAAPMAYESETLQRVDMPAEAPQAKPRRTRKGGKR